jgi:hypothetical protein
MRPDELADEIARLIEAADIRFSKEVIRVQQELYNKLVGVLRTLELDSDGYILQTSSNRAILRKAEGIFDDVIKNSVYTDAVNDHVSNIPEIESLNQKYFETVDKFFKPNRVFLKELRTQVIRDVNTFALNDGLIANVKIPLNQILNQNINSGGSFAGFLDQLRNFISGDGRTQGKLLSYSRTFLTDALFNYSRAYQQGVTRDLDLEFYLYQGGITEGGKGSSGTRDFCLERMGNYYHHKEIEAWAAEEWAGKRQGTTESSIFIFAGGWNCKHSLIPVSETIVPKIVIDRNVENGNYRP